MSAIQDNGVNILQSVYIERKLIYTSPNECCRPIKVACRSAPESVGPLSMLINIGVRFECGLEFVYVCGEPAAIDRAICEIGFTHADFHANWGRE